jgi:hypothetical protein
MIAFRQESAVNSTPLLSHPQTSAVDGLIRRSGSFDV